jgi:hypothetical protein
MGEKIQKQVNRWQDRINVSRKWRDSVAEENRWNTFLDELKGKYDVVLGNTYVPPINEMFAYKDSILSNLFYRDPYIAVNPKRNASIEGAYILEAAVNYYWRELKIKEEIELQITDVLFVGHAWNKVGMNVKTSGSGEQLKLEKDQLFSTRVSWRDMFMNVGCQKPPKDNLWIAQRIYRPTEDLKKDYGRVASRITGGTHPNVNDQLRKNLLYKEDFNYSAIYEIWDAREKKIYLICDEVNNDYLEDPRDWPDCLDEYGFQFLSLHEIPDEPYPQSDVAPWEAQVKEKIKVFTMSLNHIKRWNRQMIVKKGTMTASEVDKFEKGIDGSILFANTTGDIQTAMKMVDFGSLPPDIYMIMDRLDQVIRTTRGLAEFQQGGITRTATRTEGELQMMQRGSDARTDRKLNRIERHCENIARHLIAHMKDHFVVETMAKITGKEPPEILKAFQDQGKFNPGSGMITFTSEDIKGEYDVTVKSGSTLPLDKGTRDKILDQVMQTGAQMAAVPTLPPFMAEVMKERLRDYDIKGLEVAFDQQMQSQQQAASQQEATSDLDSQKVMAETSKRQAQAQQINVDTIIKSANSVARATDMISPEVSLEK